MFTSILSVALQLSNGFFSSGIRDVFVFFSYKQMWLWVFLYVGFAEDELMMPPFHFTSLHVCHVADCRELEENDVKGWLWWNTHCTVFYKI